MNDRDQIIAELIANLENKALGSVDVKRRTDVVGYTLAVALATNLTLPAAPVAGVSNYYLIQHMPSVRRSLCQVNEIYVIDVEKALELARLVYHFRYRMVYDANLIATNLSAIALSGITAIPQDVAESLNGVDNFEVNSAIKTIIEVLGN